MNNYYRSYVASLGLPKTSFWNGSYDILLQKEGFMLMQGDFSAIRLFPINNSVADTEEKNLKSIHAMCFCDMHSNSNFQEAEIIFL